MSHASQQSAPLRLISGRYLILLVTLVLLAVLEPIIVSTLVLDICFSLVLLAAVWALRRNRWQFAIGVVLLVPNMLLKWSLWPMYGNDTHWLPTMATIHLISQILFLVYVTLMILGHVLRSRRVTGDTICGAICVYILMGIIWAVIFMTIHLHDPFAFDLAETEQQVLTEIEETVVGEEDPTAVRDPLPALAASEQARRHRAENAGSAFSRYIYFSFVTLSTLGYGDITPVAYGARTFAWLEAVSGQLFLAVLIARLVGLHIVHEEQMGPLRGDSDDDDN